MKRVEHCKIRRVNDWWWALGSFGGSIVKRVNGYFFHPNNRSLSIYPNRRTKTIVTGPFFDLSEALKEASLVRENFWLLAEPSGDIPKE